MSMWQFLANEVRRIYSNLRLNTVRKHKSGEGRREGEKERERKKGSQGDEEKQCGEVRADKP